MKPQLVRWAMVILLAAGVGVGVACKKKAGATVESSQAEHRLTGASNVTEALNKKDYSGAIAALVKVREAVATAEQQTDFMMFSREVRGILTEAAASDPKAAEALQTLRVVTGGR